SPHATTPRVPHVRAHHRRAHVRAAKQRRDGPEVVARRPGGPPPTVAAPSGASPVPVRGHRPEASLSIPLPTPAHAKLDSRPSSLDSRVRHPPVGAPPPAGRPPPADRRPPPTCPMPRGAPLPTADPLLPKAAELRANGCSWVAAARELDQHPDVLKRRADASRPAWRKLLGQARRDVIEEAFAEAVLALRADIRGDDPKLKQAAANMLLRLWMRP